MSALVLQSSSTSSRLSSHLPLVAPALVVLASYGFWLWSSEMPGAAEVVRLQKDIKTLEAGVPTLAMIEELRERETRLKENLASEEGAFKQVELQVKRVSNSSHTPIERMELLILLTAVFERHRMVVASDRNVETTSRPQLVSSLDRGLRDLSSALQKVNLPTQGKAAPYQPIFVPGMERPMTAEELGLTRSSGGQLPPLQLREVTVIGSYHDFISALETIRIHCPNLSVIAIEMEPADDRGHGVHNWTVLICLHPSPLETSTSPTPTPPETPSMLVAEERP